jgi:14-3-3 protein epsilon
MVEYMKKVAEGASEDLSLEERNLLSVAYKNVVGARRASLRIIGSIESKEKEKQSTNAGLVGTYKGKVEAELNAICNDILDLLNNQLIPKSSSMAEANVFYMKMKAGNSQCACLVLTRLDFTRGPRGDEGRSPARIPTVSLV